MLFMEQLLPGFDGNLQPILRGCDGTRPNVVIGTIGVIGNIEIHQKMIAW
jgi:hypothetical protein